ncbi:hypothetical protein FCH28_28885 [Streptomyces piniterrae]|uniref:Uncharacterized protein n=1 Tax=Streptomyces piniterrae TaxID=2571125 RepID=A0A4U0N6Q1_9ACTN|nr:hypothetical protein [Streptomyces piniterrae]TJZ45354.1 hypothetical protein FCH28_28885 [Streptomyces piniterrae]
MPTAIAVTSPDLALPATDRQTPAAVILRSPQLQPLDEALTETGAVLEHHGHLVVLYSAACPPDHIRRLHTLRALLESDRIAILPLDLPPLGVAVVARQLRQLSLCDFSPGVLACAARLLAHYVHAGALLGSVSGLDRVEVDLRSHMKSWLPGTHFAVLANPEPRLLHVDRHSSEAGLPAPGFATRLAVARGQLTGEWVGGVLAPAWRTQGVYEERLPAESARWWGTQKLVEFAAAIPDLSVLYQLVSSVRREDCRWCGLELIGDRCAFCAEPVARDGAPGGQARRGAGGPAAIEGRAADASCPTPPAAPASAPVTQAPAPPPPPPPPAPPAPPAPPGPASYPVPDAPPEALRQRGLSPVAPSGVPGGRGARGGPGRLDVRGPDMTGGPYAAGAGQSYAAQQPYAPGGPGGYGAPDVPAAPGAPCVPGAADIPSDPRTVARVR